MVSKESSGAVVMKLTAMYTKTATDQVTKTALGIAIAQYLQRSHGTHALDDQFRASLEVDPHNGTH